jgi:hypothetical protein
MTVLNYIRNKQIEPYPTFSVFAEKAAILLLAISLATLYPSTGFAQKESDGWLRVKTAVERHYSNDTLKLKAAYRYADSSLGKMFICEKDMFYRFMNNGNVRWRKLLYAMNLQLLKKVHRSTMSHGKPVCLIIDDTDARRAGRRANSSARCSPTSSIRAYLVTNALHRSCPMA